MFGKRLGPRPAAHSIFKKPREMDVHACPPLAERIGGVAGVEGGAYSRARESQHGVESDPSRTKPPRARSARTSAFTLVISSSGV